MLPVRVFMILSTVVFRFSSQINLGQNLLPFSHNNLKVNFKKVFFGSRKVNYLGFHLTEHGIKPGTAKLKAVQTAKPPETVRQVRQFLGFVVKFAYA
jgi:hypothetical protein